MKKEIVHGSPAKDFVIGGKTGCDADKISDIVKG